MANYNKVLLIGNLTRDPELRYAGGGEGGTAICKFGLAVNRQWRSPSGEMQEETCFVDIKVFGRQAETCNEYLAKGRPVFVEGRLHLDSWDDKETGKKRSRHEVVAERVQFLGGRGEGQGGGPQGEQSRDRGGDRGGYRREAPPRAPAPAASTSDRGPSSAGVDYDDIPF